MARSNKAKRIFEPSSKEAVVAENQKKYYDDNPSWKFHLSDRECWSFSSENVSDDCWSRILEHLIGWETQTWNEILIVANKQNHPIDVERLNKRAKDRLLQLHIEAESIISLRLSGTQRLYGIMDGSSFSIIWFDKNHGDNEICVCRSHKKGT